MAKGLCFHVQTIFKPNNNLRSQARLVPSTLKRWYCWGQWVASRCAEVVWPQDQPSLSSLWRWSTSTHSPVHRCVCPPGKMFSELSLWFPDASWEDVKPDDKTLVLFYLGPVAFSQFMPSPGQLQRGGIYLEYQKKLKPRDLLVTVWLWLPC